MKDKTTRLTDQNDLLQTNKELNQKLIELTSHLQRERADFVNYKRRAEDSRMEILNLAKQNIILEILPLMDNIERILGHIPKELVDDCWAKGVVQVAKQAEQVLTNLGVTKIKAKGEHFNPELHEALSLQDGEGKNEIVKEELQTGYMLGDKVLRPTLVKVIKKDIRKGENNG